MRAKVVLRLFGTGIVFAYLTGPLGAASADTPPSPVSADCSDTCEVTVDKNYPKTFQDWAQRQTPGAGAVDDLREEAGRQISAALIAAGTAQDDIDAQTAPKLPNTEVKDAETEAYYSAGDTSDAGYYDAAAAKSNGPVLRYTVVDVAQVPSWVRALSLYRERQALDLPLSGVTYFSTDAAVVAAADGPNSCPDHRVCLWQHSEFRGRMFYGAQAGYWYTLDQYGFKNITSSWRNRARQRAGCVEGDYGYVAHLPARHIAGHIGSYNDKWGYYKIGGLGGGC